MRTYTESTVPMSLPRKRESESSLYEVATRTQSGGSVLTVTSSLGPNIRPRIRTPKKAARTARSVPRPPTHCAQVPGSRFGYHPAPITTTATLPIVTRTPTAKSSGVGSSLADHRSPHRDPLVRAQSADRGGLRLDEIR